MYNDSMLLLPSEVRDAVDHLPPAAVLTLDGISWEDYETLSDSLGDRPGVRLTYDQGRLDIVTTSLSHEKWKEMLLLLVTTLCEELKIKMESAGQTTLKKMKDLKGVEADTCFYIANAGKIIGKSEINLRVDPPPDLVVEIDKASQALRKFLIYASFGVPEIWRCNVRLNRIQMYALQRGEYVEIPSSLSFPMLDGSVLVRFIEQSHRDGQMAGLAAFRQWSRGE
jgi:Uma2 family endonuclease